MQSNPDILSDGHPPTFDRWEGSRLWAAITGGQMVAPATPQVSAAGTREDGGDADIPVFVTRLQAVMLKAGEAHQFDERNPVQGVWGLRPRSTWLAWGAFDWRQSKPGLTGPGTGGKSAGCEKLNHERPARACQ